MTSPIHLRSGSEGLEGCLGIWLSMKSCPWSWDSSHHLHSPGRPPAWILCAPVAARPQLYDSRDPMERGMQGVLMTRTRAELVRNKPEAGAQDLAPDWG